MSNHRRHLRYLVTSALLVGPAMGCGSAEPEVTNNSVAPVEVSAEDPTGNPVGPEPEAIAVEEQPPPMEEPTVNLVAEPEATLEEPPVEEPPAEPEPEVQQRAEPRPHVNMRRPARQARPSQDLPVTSKS